MRTILNSESVNTLEAFSLYHAANFSEDEACELMCTLSDKAVKLNDCNVMEQGGFTSRQVRFDIVYATDSFNGSVKAIDK